MGCANSVNHKLAAEASPRQNLHEAYELGRKLGEGACGQVRVAIRSGDAMAGSTEKVAVKIVDLRRLDSDGNLCAQIDKKREQNARVEETIWKRVGDDQHCVKLIETFFDNNIYYMVMEKCKCSMLGALSKLRKYSAANIGDIFRQMLLGVRHIHSVAVIHRDIKPDNFLFGGPKGTQIKLCDFGMATVLPVTGKVFGQLGTPPYMSPEMLRTTGYREETDMWSFGATVYVVLYGAFPYNPPEPDAEMMKQAIRTGTPSPSFSRRSLTSEDPSPCATSFVRSLLRRCASSRPTAAEALLDEFLSTSDSTTVKDAVPAAVVVKQAQQTTQAFRAPRNVILQKSLDQIMDELQAAGVGNAWFSEKKKTQKPPPDEWWMRPRLSRSSSCTGSLGRSVSSLDSSSTYAPTGSRATTLETLDPRTRTFSAISLESLPQTCLSNVCEEAEELSTSESEQSHNEGRKDEQSAEEKRDESGGHKNQPQGRYSRNEGPDGRPCHVEQPFGIQSTNTGPDPDACRKENWDNAAWAPELWGEPYVSEVKPNSVPGKDSITLPLRDNMQ